MAPDIKEYDPFEALAAPAPPLNVSPVEFSKEPITGFREPERLMSSAVAVQTRSFFKRRNAHVRHSYTALPPEHIRILIIRPGRTGQKLELDLMQISFEEPYTNLQPYEALSYDWDSGPAVFPVILRDYTRRSLNERYPINGDERASTTHWKRVCFAIFRDFKKVRWDESRQYVEDQNKWLDEGYDRFGTTTFIQENLWSALERLRDRKTAVRIWADDICINQPNQEEKMQQIALMGQIYNRATHVCIWLGEKSDQSDIAMDYVREIQEEKASGKLSRSDPRGYEVERKWSALAELLRSRWFSRRWVLQEIALSQRASVYCGDKRVTWVDFASAIAIFLGRACPERLDQYASQNRELSMNEGPNTPDLMKQQTKKTRLTQEGLRTLKGSGANALVAAHNGLVRFGERGTILERKKDLEESISTLTPFDCNDPRDIVYAVLSIAAYEPQKILQPNTNKSLLQVYTEFIEYCVQHLHSFNMICRFWAPKDKVIIKEISQQDTRRFESHLPSWIKCLEHSTYGTPDRIFVGQKEPSSLVGPPSQSWYKASGTRRPQVTFGKKPQSDVPHVLHEEFDGTASARGICLGTITELSSRMLPDVLSREAIALAGWNHSGAEENFHAGDVPDTVWRTLIADKTVHGQQPSADYQTYCLRMLQQEDARGDIHLDKMIKTVDAGDRLAEFLRRVRDVCFNRKIFAINKLANKSIGIGPRQARIGDTVAVLYGCNVPVVMRPQKHKPVFGLDPACNNDLRETKSREISMDSKSLDESRYDSMIEATDTTDSSDDMDKHHDDENPWLDWQSCRTPGSSKTNTGSSATSSPSLSLTKSSQQNGPSRTMTFNSSDDMDKSHDDENPWMDQQPLTPGSSRATTNSSLDPSPFLDLATASHPSGLSRAVTYAAESQNSQFDKETSTYNLPRKSSSTINIPGEGQGQKKQSVTGPSEIYYELIGECFVCDKMDGGVCPGDQPLLWEETFTLI